MAVAACLGLPQGVAAQLNGPNIKGDAGLKSGSQAPPGGYVVVPLYFYSADALKGRDGNELAKGSLDAAVFGAGLNYVTTKKVGTANFGFLVVLPFANNRVQGGRIDENPGQGLTDMYVQPANLGWHSARADTTLAYGLYLPTGRYADGASDNGAEFLRPWDGWSGPWRGAYFTALEGGIRAPFLVRWPGKIAAGRVSNEIVHGADLFATLARFAGAKVPADRPMDSIDQSDFFLGHSEKSAREGFPIWCADRLMAVKWRNWKMHFIRQDTMFDPPVKNPVPTIYNLYTDPREEKPTADSWVVGPVLKIVGEFEHSVKQHPLIAMGTPDPYTPAK